jgi:glycosyltransferase involved in cell wall biosynthesis
VAARRRIVKLVRRVRRFAGRALSGVRRRIVGSRWVAPLRPIARDLPALLARDPRTAIAVIRITQADSKQRTIIPVLDRAIRIRPSRALRARRAEVLGLSGELTASRDAWQALAAGGDASTASRLRRVEGRLIETDPGWLPSTGQPREELAPASRRRILHIAKSSVPARWSGFTIRTLQNLRAQRDAGLEPIVVTKIGWPREMGVDEVPAGETFEGFEIHYLDRGPAYRHKALPADIPLRDMAADLVPLVRELRPAILHAHSGHRGGEHALVALALREQFGTPVVYEVRGLFESSWTSDTTISERAEIYHRRLAQETRILHDVDGVVAISEALADDLVARGIPRAKITIVPNGIDAAALGEAERDPALRARLGLDGRFVVGYLGNLDHWREGIENLITALAELHRRGRSEVAVLVVGDGTRRASLEDHAARLGVAGSIRFTGRVPHEEVGQYYAQMELFTNPRVDERASRYITPLKPFEAMALGVPVLVSDLPALREIVDPPTRGVVAPPGDAAELAAAIELLVDDPVQRARLGAAGRDWVRSERTWAANGQRYRAAYEAILGPLD